MQTAAGAGLAPTPNPTAAPALTSSSSIVQPRKTNTMTQ